MVHGGLTSAAGQMSDVAAGKLLELAHGELPPRPDEPVIRKRNYEGNAAMTGDLTNTNK